MNFRNGNSYQVEAKLNVNFPLSCSRTFNQKQLVQRSHQSAVCLSICLTLKKWEEESISKEGSDAELRRLLLSCKIQRMYVSRQCVCNMTWNSTTEQITCSLTIFAKWERRTNTRSGLAFPVPPQMYNVNSDVFYCKHKCLLKYNLVYTEFMGLFWLVPFFYHVIYFWMYSIRHLIVSSKETWHARVSDSVHRKKFCSEKSKYCAALAKNNKIKPWFDQLSRSQQKQLWKLASKSWKWLNAQVPFRIKSETRKECSNGGESMQKSHDRKRHHPYSTK